MTMHAKRHNIEYFNQQAHIHAYVYTFNLIDNGIFFEIQLRKRAIFRSLLTHSYEWYTTKRELYIVPYSYNIHIFYHLFIFILSKH